MQASNLGETCGSGTPFEGLAGNYVPGAEAVTDDGILPVTALPKVHRDLFSFDNFNAMQSVCFDVAYLRDDNMVLSAPTGSGKTVVLELAILNAISKSDFRHSSGKVIYIAPVKALCSSVFQSWSTKFSSLGLTCCEFTGDSESPVESLIDSHLVITTAEKLEAATRRRGIGQLVSKQIRLLLVDEVHTVAETHRGPTLEALVARLKLVTDDQCRIIAVSATVPNFRDIAHWLGKMDSNLPATCMAFDNTYRPVPLETVVRSYPHSFPDSMAFDSLLNYKILGLVSKFSERRPTLVFCCTRKSASGLAQFLVDSARSPELQAAVQPSSSELSSLVTLQAQLESRQLKETVYPHGVAFHHAGLSPGDRRLIENAFSESLIKILCTTSTLAIGVNLPARLVIVKGTQTYAEQQFCSYTSLDMQQMVGRAGRAQFDTKGVAVIMTHPKYANRWQSIIRGQEMLQSGLKSSINNFLCAEISLRNVKTINDAKRWISATFYGSMNALEAVEELSRAIEQLITLGIIELYNGYELKATELCNAISKFFLSPESLNSLCSAMPTTIPEALLTVSKCREFLSVRCTASERSNLERLNGLIKYPLERVTPTVWEKVYILCQAVLTNANLFVNSWQTQEAYGILQIFRRVSRCLVQLAHMAGSADALVSALLLTQSLEARLWHDSSQNLLAQIEGVGSVICRQLGRAGIKTLADALEASAHSINEAANRQPPFGQQLIQKVKRLPFIEAAIHLDEGLREHGLIVLYVKLSLRFALEPTSKARPIFIHVLVTSPPQTLGSTTLLHYQTISVGRLTGSELTTCKLTLSAGAEQRIRVLVLQQEFVGLNLKADLHLHDLKGTPVKLSSLVGSSSDRVNRHDGETSYSRELSALDVTPPKIECRHSCDKTKCKHKCCKVGLTGKRKAQSSINGTTSASKRNSLPLTPQSSTSTTLLRSSPTASVSQICGKGGTELPAGSDLRSFMSKYCRSCTPQSEHRGVKESNMTRTVSPSPTGVDLIDYSISSDGGNLVGSSPSCRKTIRRLDASNSERQLDRESAFTEAEDCRVEDCSKFDVNLKFSTLDGYDECELLNNEDLKLAEQQANKRVYACDKKDGSSISKNCSSATREPLAGKLDAIYSPSEASSSLSEVGSCANALYGRLLPWIKRCRARQICSSPNDRPDRG